ncbi:MBG domain-containing protein, partial [Terrisporobacter sp.]
MHKKRIISLGLSLAMFANTVPTNLLEASADEVSTQSEVNYLDENVNSKEDVVQQEETETEVEEAEVGSVTTEDGEGKEGEAIPQSEEMTRTVNAEFKIENESYGKVEGLNGNNKIVLTSIYNDVTSDTRFGTTTYKGTLISNDNEKEIVVTPKEGYQFDTAQYLVLEGIALANQSISIKKDGDKVIIKVSPLTSGSWDKNFLGDKTNESPKMQIKFSKKSNAQSISTEVEGEGKIVLDDSEDLVYEDGKYIIEKGTAHTFKVMPGDGMEVKSVTLDGEPVAVVDGKVTVGVGTLKAVFGEPVDKIFDLDVTVTGEGSVVVANQTVDSNNSSKVVLNAGESYTYNLKPAEGYYISSVKVDGKEVTDYKIENVDTNHTLEVVFAEKMDTKIILSELKVSYDGSEKSLEYTVVDSNGDVVEKGNAQLKEKNWLGQWVNVTPSKIGSYRFIIDYPGDNTHKPVSESGEFEIYDAREEVVIELSDLSKVYNGKVQYPTAVLKDGKTGQVIEDTNVDIKYDFDLDLTKTKGKDVGSYAFKASFGGNDKYMALSVSGTFEVTKCTPKVSVGNKQVQYDGQAVPLPVTVTPESGYITVYTGLNVKLSPNIYLDLNLGDDLVSQTIKKILGNADLGNVGNLVELLKNNQDLLATLGVDVSKILEVLEIVPTDIGLHFGAPNRPGAYLATAVVADSNANTAFGVGTLLITRQEKKVVFSENSLEDKAYIKYGTEYNHQAYYEGTTSAAKLMYSGITAKGEAYFSSKKPTELGTYAVVAYSYDDLEYQVALAARTFTIGKYLTNLEITSGNKTYDGTPYEATSLVKDYHGNVVENATVEYTYYKGLTKLDSAPKDEGRYLVRATFKGTDEYFASSNVKHIEIGKAQVTPDDTVSGDGSEDDNMGVTPDDTVSGDGSEDDNMGVTPDDTVSGDGSEDDNMGVTPDDTVSGDGSEDDNMGVAPDDTVSGDGSEDDNMQVTPDNTVSGDGSEDDNMGVTPDDTVSGDGSEDDNMGVTPDDTVSGDGSEDG